MTQAGTMQENPIARLKAALEEARAHWRAGCIESACRAYDLVEALTRRAARHPRSHAVEFRPAILPERATSC